MCRKLAADQRAKSREWAACIDKCKQNSLALEFGEVKRLAVLIDQRARPAQFDRASSRGFVVAATEPRAALIGDDHVLQPVVIRRFGPRHPP